MTATKSPVKKVTRSSRKSKKAKPADTEECPHCRPGSESFRYFNGAYKFDVDLARKIVSDGRESVELEPDDVKYSVDMSRIYPQHLPHVDTKFPGIIAHVWGPDGDGKWLHGHLLIDGHHRAARCLQLGIPYRVYLLTKQESEQVVLHGPVSRRRVKTKEGPIERQPAPAARR
jgi:hypothetical protein